jgi:hypothetical protein
MVARSAVRAFVTLVLLARGAAARGDDSEVSSPKPFVLRIHSLAGLVEHEGYSEAAIALLPYRVSSKSEARFEAYGTDRADGGEVTVMSGEDVVSLVRNTVDPAIWEEGAARIDLAEETRLVVTAPAETQDRIAELLGSLLPALAPRTLLQVGVLRGTPPADAPALPDFKAADAIDAQLEVVRRVQVALRGRNAAAATSLLAGSGVFDWDVEIAQGAVVGNPIVASVRTGIEVIARAAPAEGGVFVALLVREAEPAAEPVVRTLDARGAIVAQQVVNERAAGGVVQHPRLGFVSYAGTAFLPNGHALLLPVSVQTHVGAVAFTLELRLAGEVPAARTVLDARVGGEGAPLQIGIASFGLSALGRIEVETVPARLFDSGSGGLDPQAWIATLNQERSIDRACEVANSIATPAMEAGTASLTPWGNYLVTVLPAESFGAVADAMAALERRTGGELVGRIVGAGGELSRFRVPYVEDRPLALWSGVQGTRIADWDVDVANESFIPNPAMEAWVDGFALRLRVGRDARGRAVVHANGVLNFLDGPPQKVDLGDANHLAIETVRARRCAFDDVRTLPEGKAQRAFFGSSELTLDLEVKPH